MRSRELALGAFAATIALCVASACGGGDDEDSVFVAKKDSGTGGKDSGTGGKDAGSDASSGGNAGSSSGGASGASGGGGTAGGDGGSAGSGNGGSAGGGGTQADASTGGTGGVDAGKCEDNATNEPNGTEATAASASAATCGAASKELSGVIAGNDIDWYEYSGGGGITCAATASPTVKVDHASLRGCVYAECNGAGTTTVTCAQGATSTSPNGLKGCCASGGEAEAAVGCTNLLDKSVTVRMRVDQSPASPNACFAYKLTYSL